MSKENKGIRDKIKQIGVRYYEVADVIGISPYTFSIWLRKPLKDERLKRVEVALNKLKEANK